jgi:pyruvate dehydrogenase E1 component
MFEDAGWRTIVLKYGRTLQRLFGRDGGGALRRRIDEMGNEEYQRLLRAEPAELRDRLPGSGRGRRDVERLVADLRDDELGPAIRDLGGHDLGGLLDAFREADLEDRPTVIFAYTIKARGLPTEGHPANHSALLSSDQWQALAEELEADPRDPWARFADGSPEAELCADAAHRLRRKPRSHRPPPPVPGEIGRDHSGNLSTQQGFGRFLTELRRVAPDVAERVVTTSPDVALSTNLGGWINHAGVWNPTDRTDWFGDDTDTLVHWREGRMGQHIELGIAEANMVGLLGELGATWSREGEPLLPIGTLYDPFLGRALEPWSFGIYAGGQSILVGTPSGVSLAPEGGAHQSVITPSIGIEQPLCTAWEPAFGQDLEWTLLAALGRLARPDGESAYFRLSTRPIDQSLASLPEDPEGRERRRCEVLAGGYVLRSAPTRPQVTIVAVGVTVPEACGAADELGDSGIATDVVCLTSPDLVYRALRARQGLADGEQAVLDALFPAERAAPIVSVQDGHPHALSFLSAINQAPSSALGVDHFGQSGDVGDVYRHFGIDVDTIVGAALDLLG